MPAAPQSQPLVSVSPKGKPVILCVDDVKEILDTLEEQLSTHLGREFTFEMALSGEEGLEVIDDLLARGREVAVIISDVIMPGMKGDEFLIEAHKRTPKTLKIMLTGQESTLSQITDAINQAQLYRFLSKPWDILDMQRTIEEAARSYVERNLIEEQNRTLKLLHHASQVISRQVSLTDLYADILRLMLEYSGADRAALVLLENDELYLKASRQKGSALQIADNGHPAKELTILPHTWIRQVLAQEAPTLVENTHRDMILKADPYVLAEGIRAVLGLPLVNQGKLIGGLLLESKKEFSFGADEHLEVLGILAAQAAISVENGRLYEHLEELVSSRTHQLMAANIQKDEMVRFVSHEIRSPLSGILSLIELLEEPEISGNAEEVQRYGRLIKGSTANVIKLANDILDLAKLESGTISLNVKPVEIGELIRSVTEGFKPLLMSKNIELQLELHEPISLPLDESKFSSVIGNLLSNAIKFTSKGGSIAVRLMRAQQYAVMEVSDTGIGIREEQLPLLFEKFGAKQRLGTEGERGTGLGLSIVKELVKLHEGEVSATSVVGEGSTFRIELPIS